MAALRLKQKICENYRSKSPMRSGATSSRRMFLGRYDFTSWQIRCLLTCEAATSGFDVIKALERLGYQKARRTGSN